MGALHDIKIKDLLGANPVVAIDGENIADQIKRVTLDCSVGAVPQVFVEMAPQFADVEIQGAMVLVKDMSVSQVIQIWLEDLDPGLLEQRALEGLNELGGSTTGELFLAALKELARGD